MKSMTTRGTGNSRFLKSAIAPDITHEQLVALLRAGTFPIDFAGLNPAGIEEEGTPLTPATLLDAETADMYALAEPNATPNMALRSVPNKITEAGVYVATTTTLSTTGANLQSTLNSLPKLINNNVVINVSGTVSGNITVGGFYGPGTLQISGGSGGSRTAISGVAYIMDCAMRLLRFENFNITHNTGTGMGTTTHIGCTNAHVHVLDCDGLVYLKRVDVVRPATKVSSVPYFIRRTRCVIDDCCAQNRGDYVALYQFAELIINIDASRSSEQMNGDCTSHFDLNGACKYWWLQKSQYHNYGGYLRNSSTFGNFSTTMSVQTTTGTIL